MGGVLAGEAATPEDAHAQPHQHPQPGVGGSTDPAAGSAAAAASGAVPATKTEDKGGPCNEAGGGAGEQGSHQEVVVTHEAQTLTSAQDGAERAQGPLKLEAGGGGVGGGGGGDGGRLQYELVAVLIHKGQSASHGHYGGWGL